MRFSTFLYHSNKPATLGWVGTDSEERFTSHNLKKLTKQERDTLAYYDNHPITYKVNAEGFRDVSLQHKPKEVDVFLGCSHTFGVGLHKQHLWTTKLADYNKFPSINAGIPGSGVMTQFRVIKYLLDRFKVRKVYHYSILEHVRYEWFSGQNFITTGLFELNVKSVDTYSPLCHEENLALQKYVYYNAIENLCINAGAEYYPFTDEVLGIYIPENEEFEDKNLLARDLAHHSVSKHHQIYKNCITFNKNTFRKLHTI